MFCLSTVLARLLQTRSGPRQERLSRSFPFHSLREKARSPPLHPLTHRPHCEKLKVLLSILSLIAPIQSITCISTVLARLLQTRSGPH
jgi:hypothetical protein